MKINIDFLKKYIFSLEKAFFLIQKNDKKDIDYELYRSAIIKEFEIILEQSGKLLKKILEPYFHSKKEVDRLYFKDIFRNSVLHNLISLEESERWMKYRDNRNSTSHDYGKELAEETLPLIDQFIIDSRALITVIEKHNNDFKG